MTENANMPLGRCAICDEGAIIIGRDPFTGMRYGRCCQSDLGFANQFLQISINQGSGIRHPGPGEFPTENQENH